jgi:hypothetical protein
MLKAYIDDSRMRQPPYYVLGGWFAPVHAWTKFSDAWHDVLWMRPRIEYFKYEEAMNFTGQFHGISEERRNEKLRLLVNLIEEYQLQGICSVIPHNLFKPLFGDVPDKSGRNPYFLSFLGISALLAAIHEKLQSQEQVEIIFDYQPGSDAMREVQDGWEDFRRFAPPNLLRYVQMHPPTFLDDKDVMGLQAADLHAGWSRYQIECLDGWQMPVPIWYPSGEKINTHTKSWDAPSLLGIFESAFGVVPILASYTLQHGLAKPSDVFFLRFL